MKSTKMILSLLLIASFSQAKEKQKTEKQKPLECQEVTSDCRVCADGSMFLKNAQIKKPLSRSLYDCVSSGESKVSLPDGTEKKFSQNTQKCVIASAFCAVCDDGTFLFWPQKKSISSDAFECVTKPRLQRSTVAPTK